MSPLNLPPGRLSFIGQGKLGCPIAAALATRGFEVVGVDSDAARVTAINAKQAPIFEPGLAELMTQAGDSYRATTDVTQAVLQTEASFIIVPTPSGADGGFVLDAVLAVCTKIGHALARKSGYHLVVVTSTVMPGSTGGPVRQALENASGKRCGADFGLCYSPEFVALGSVIHDCLHPDMLLIGQSDERAGGMLEAIGLAASLSKPAVARMNFVNAEIAKIAVNTFVTTKITYANMLASICHNLPGGDVDAVTQALGLDSRIGRKYLTGAVGYGGPCFPRDNLALACLARRIGAASDLAESVDAANRRSVQRLADLVAAHRAESAVIGVLGLAYKPDTDVVEQAQGLMLLRELRGRGLPVIGFDPAANHNARAALGPDVELAATLEEAVSRADVLVLVTPWPQFKQLESMTRSRRVPPRVIIDCWRYLDAARLAAADPSGTYVALGRGPAEEMPPAAATNTSAEAAA